MCLTLQAPAQAPDKVMGKSRFLPDSSSTSSAARVGRSNGCSRTAADLRPPSLDVNVDLLDVSSAAEPAGSPDILALTSSAMPILEHSLRQCSPMPQLPEPVKGVYRADSTAAVDSQAYLVTEIEGQGGAERLRQAVTAATAYPQPTDVWEAEGAAHPSTRPRTSRLLGWTHPADEVSPVLPARAEAEALPSQLCRGGTDSDRSSDRTAGVALVPKPPAQSASHSEGSGQRRLRFVDQPAHDLLGSCNVSGARRSAMSPATAGQALSASIIELNLQVGLHACNVMCTGGAEWICACMCKIVAVEASLSFIDSLLLNSDLPDAKISSLHCSAASSE